MDRPDSRIGGNDDLLKIKLQIKTTDDLRTFLQDDIFSRLELPNGEVYEDLIPPSILNSDTGIFSDQNMEVFQKAFTYKDYEYYHNSYEGLKNVGSELCALFIAELISEQIGIVVNYNRIQHSQILKLIPYYKSNKPYG